MSRNRGKPKRSLRDLNREAPRDEEVEVVFRELIAASDRTAAVLSAALLDHFVYLRIRFKLKLGHDSETMNRLTEHEGSLSTAFAKNYLGYAMGLYDKGVLTDMEVIRVIRNAFAHSARPIDFNTPEVKRACDKFTWHPKGEIEKEIAEGTDGELSYCRRLFVHNVRRVLTLIMAPTLIQLHEEIEEIRKLREEIKKLPRPDADT